MEATVRAFWWGQHSFISVSRAQTMRLTLPCQSLGLGDCAEDARSGVARPLRGPHRADVQSHEARYVTQVRWSERRSSCSRFPTRLDKIKNFHIDAHLGPVGLSLLIVPSDESPPRGVKEGFDLTPRPAAAFSFSAPDSRRRLVEYVRGVGGCVTQLAPRVLHDRSRCPRVRPEFAGPHTRWGSPA